MAAERVCDPIPFEAEAGDCGLAEQVYVEVDLRRALSSLSAREKHTLLLRYWGDLTNQQIAARTATPVGTIKVRLHRASARLRELLAP